MFETEVKEWANKMYPCDGQAQRYLIEGAKFGYNKANEWHYVKDGKYPTDDKKVLCILGDFENDNLEVGYYSQVEGDSKRWRFENYDLPDDSEEDWGVSAWKEIVLPKERLNDTTISDYPIKDDRLTKAKEIIKQLMYASRDCIAWYCLCDKAKQFLKEIEK